MVVVVVVVVVVVDGEVVGTAGAGVDVVGADVEVGSVTSTDEQAARICVVAMTVASRRRWRFIVPRLPVRVAHADDLMSRDVEH